MAVDWLLSFRARGSEGEEIANTICVHDDAGTGGVSPANGDDFLDEVDTWLTTKYRALLSVNAVLDELHAFRIPATYGDDTEVFTKLKGTAGTFAGGDGKLPREICLIMQLKSTHTSRRKQGRLFLPTTRDSALMNASGAFSTASAWWTKVGDFGDALLAGHDFSTDNHLSTRVYSRRQHIEGTGDKTSDVNSYNRVTHAHFLRRRTSIP